jgi:2-polyprenyl-3-methyl-5-hydroxy-6-metoxy-1,4-benzoquinol methylase
MNASEAVARAARSCGTSDPRLYAVVREIVRRHGIEPGTVVDVGCGTGSLARSLEGAFHRYVGCDLVAYEGFPVEPWATFIQANLDEPPYPMAEASGDVVVAVETIEHLENPRRFVRELARIAKPQALVIITTPNQLSLLSKLTLLFKNQFNAFQDGCYPAHLTALLETDLIRIALECGLTEIRIQYSNSGRIPLTAWHWPPWPGGRGFSDNVLLEARRP